MTKHRCSATCGVASQHSSTDSCSCACEFECSLSSEFCLHLFVILVLFNKSSNVELPGAFFLPTPCWLLLIFMLLNIGCFHDTSCCSFWILVCFGGERHLDTIRFWSCVPLSSCLARFSKPESSAGALLKVCPLWTCPGWFHCSTAAVLLCTAPSVAVLGFFLSGCLNARYWVADALRLRLPLQFLFIV